jgi:hypothetical protein
MASPEHRHRCVCGGRTFTTASGQPMTFARGPVWIVLAATP